MGIDASIYGNIQPVKTPDVMGAVQGAMQLSTLGMQQQQMQRQMQQQQMALNQQQALRDAYAQNTDQNGNLNQAGFLSTLGKNPLTADKVPELQNTFSNTSKNQSESLASKMDAQQKVTEASLPVFQALAKMNEQQRAAAAPDYLKQLEDKGVPMPNWPKTSDGQFMYDPKIFQTALGNLQNSAAGMKQRQAQSEIDKNEAEAKLAPLKQNAELYGARSPNATLTDQYNTDVKPIRSSQMYMQQMLDSHQNKTPQGDAALVLNNFKIRNPGATDVNSIEEMKTSQAVGDAWKNKINEALAGGFDDTTRNNLIRDGISAYRANVDTFGGIQKRYQARAAQQNVNDPTITYEPAISKTYDAAMNLQDKIGPYVPPTERGGVVGTLSKIASKVMGTSSPSNSPQSTPVIKPGTVEDGYVFNGGNPADPKNWKKAR